MIAAVSVTVFLAVALAGLAVLWWVEARAESLPRRFREIIVPAVPASRTAWPWRGIAWIGKLLRRPDAAARRDEEIAARVTGGDIEGFRRLLSQAGYRSPAAAAAWRVVRVGLPAVFAVAGVVYGKTAGIPDRVVVALATAAAGVGYFLPGTFLKSRARRRREEITDALPDCLDLLTVCVEAGLGINSAFIRIADEFRLSSPTLAEEFDIVNREMVAGKPRADALRSLSDRTGVEEVKALAAMLIQTEKLGTSLAQSLRVHSDSLRTRRRQRAEEAAAKTTIKLVFPLVFLLFPALFIVVLGPGVLQIIRIFFPIANGS